MASSSGMHPLIARYVRQRGLQAPVPQPGNAEKFAKNSPGNPGRGPGTGAPKKTEHPLPALANYIEVMKRRNRFGR